MTKLARTSSFRLPPSSFPIVPLAVPSWNGETYRAILRSLASAAIVDGPDIHALKFSLVERLGVAEAVLCGSGSLSLELALRACGVQPDDEVIIPAFCCSALVPPILALGALPVLADVGDDLNLTVETLDAAITRKTKAVIVPHLFGNPADIQAIVELAQGKKIRVIDDAAQALGASIGNRPLGSFGDAGIVSFGGEKICFGIGGGALVTNRRELVAAGARNLPSAQLSAVLGKLAATQFHWRWRRWTRSLQPVFSRSRRVAPDAPPIPYVKSAIANLQASVAFSLMQTLDENIAARRARVSAYRELLGHEPGLELIAHGPGSACLTQVVRLYSNGRRQDLASTIIQALGAAGYEVRGSYVPIHLLGVFHRCVWDRLPQTERLWADLIELPCEPSVSLNDVERISSVIKKFIRSHSASLHCQGRAGISTKPNGLC